MRALSEQRTAHLRQAQVSAGTLVQMALRGSSYADNFAKGKQPPSFLIGSYDMDNVELTAANNYTHVGIAFAARMQIRLASLLPENLDLAAAARDLELLTERLAQVPGFTFARLIRDVLLRARRRRVLPPIEDLDMPSGSRFGGRFERHTPAESRARLEPLPRPPPTPRMLAAPSPASAPSLSPAASTLGSTLFSGSPKLPLVHEAEAVPALDFMYAEQLWPKDTGAADLALDAWFPFPPLGKLPFPDAELTPDSDIHDSFAL